MKLYLLLFIIWCRAAFAQSYADFRAQYDNFEENDARAFQYLRPYITIAKKEGNHAEMAQAYKDAVSFSQTGKLQYADSMIAAASRSGINDLAATAYLTKGTVYYFNYRKFQPALDEFMKAWRYARTSKDRDLYYKNLYYIGVVKSYLGYCTEAKNIFTECRIFFRRDRIPDELPNLKFNRQKGYLNTLHQIGICLVEQARYREASALADHGLRESLADGDFYLERSYFYKLKGIIANRQGQHTAAVDALNNALPGILRKDDYTNASLIYFYKGKSAWSINRRREALRNFVKIDSIFRRYHFILPEVRPSYELMIKNAHDLRDNRSELYYTAQLLRADRIIAADFKYLSDKMHREYDTTDLLSAKRKLQLSIYKVYLIAGFLFVVVLYFAGTKLLKKSNPGDPDTTARVESAKIKSHPTSTVHTESRASKMSDMLVTDLLLKIDRLEQTDFFLNKKMVQNKMAALLKTNTAYLSEVINEHKGCNFNSYINRLRIRYVTKMLVENRKWRKYSVKTLAAESGFANRNTFSQAFVLYNKMTPVEFINKMDLEQAGNPEL